MLLFKKLLKFIKMRNLNQKNYRIKECACDIDEIITTFDELITTFDNMIRVIRSLEDEKIKKPETPSKIWNEFDFEEYLLSKIWPSFDTEDRPENLFICKKCPHMFLAKVYGSAPIGFDVYAIIKHAMKAHYLAHEDCPSCSNLRTGFQVTGMSTELGGEKIKTLTMKQPNNSFASLYNLTNTEADIIESLRNSCNVDKI